MLFEKFYRSVSENTPEVDGAHIIDVRGLSFKRYLEIAKLLKNKVAVITDNDGDANKNCKDKYSDFVENENIEIFYEEDESKKTFENVLYQDNKDLCDTLFGEGAEKTMLKEKTESAYKLLSQDDEIVVPDYIRRAIDWIRK